jgi:hypothetical protein
MTLDLYLQIRDMKRYLGDHTDIDAEYHSFRELEKRLHPLVLLSSNKDFMIRFYRESAIQTMHEYYCKRILRELKYEEIKVKNL